MATVQEHSWLYRWFWGHLEIEDDLRNAVDVEAYINERETILKANHFDWRFTVVASFGFLASSFSLFATSIIWPALAYVYSSHEPDKGESIATRGVGFDLVTLAGNIIGMILFGHLADRVGRKRLYGLELAIITIATIGIAFSSEGFMAPIEPTIVPPNTGANSQYFYESTMSIFDAVTTWRFLLGIGIGAEYPMSAIIAAECLSTNWRGTIIAIVFAMQSLARLLAFGFANAFLEGQRRAMHLGQDDTTYRMSILIDKAWRFIAGFGGVFAILAIGLRWTMPESPRWVRGMGDRLREALATDAERAAAAAAADAANERQNRHGGQGHLYKPPPAKARWLVGAYRYLRKDDNFKKLAVTGIIWFLLDVCFYGTGLDSPTTLNLLWLSKPFDKDAAGSAPDYEQDPWSVSQSIFWVLYNNGDRSLIVSSISSMVGSLVIIPLINYLPRKVILFWTSLALAIIFIIIGILVFTVFAEGGHTSSLVFFSLAQFAFNIGPNTIIFVLAAEIFPTMFRGTFYGLVAACGKAGAMLIRPWVQLAAYNTTHGSDGTKATPLGAMLVVFGFIMLVIACITKFWSSSLPPPQFDRKKGDRKYLPRLQNRHLEIIAPDPQPGELSCDKKTVENTQPRSAINEMLVNGTHAGPRDQWVELDEYDLRAG